MKKFWTAVKTEADIQHLLALYGNFHDSCLRDIHISTREFVDEELAMNFDNKIVATLLFQRQTAENPVIELKFEEVDRFNFNPPGPGYDALIFEATFKKVNALYFWSDERNWEVGDDEASWIAAPKVYWRFRPELLGNVTRLQPEEM